MIPGILSIATPLFAYAAFVVLAAGLFCERKNIDWITAAVATGALVASFVLVPPVHQLFFDEDIYIHIASNLAHAPVAKLTLLGSFGNSEASAYYKSPVAFPILLSFVFIVTGISEAAAFAVARTIFALMVAGVYQCARRMGFDLWQSLTAAAAVATVPVCFRFSVSAGTDMAAALFAVLGMAGIAAGNGALAAAGLALTAQTRLEMIVLVPLIFSTRAIATRWKIACVGLVLAELVQIGWVLSAASAFAAFERVPSAFGFANLLPNLKSSAAYIFDPFRFPILVPILSAIAVLKKDSLRTEDTFRLAAWIFLIGGVYLFFYAGNFLATPRYTIQLAAPMVLLAASAARRPYVLAALLLSSAVAFSAWQRGPEHAPELIADHAFAIEVASRLGQDDLVVTTESEVFFNHGVHAMNAFYTADQPEQLDRQLGRYRRVLYYAGAQTNVVNGPEWQMDQWMKSHYKLRTMEFRRVGNVGISLFEVSGKTGNGNGDERSSPAGGESNGR